MRRGLPTGAAMPLCWSHAEYVSLVRSAHDGMVFELGESETHGRLHYDARDAGWG